MTHLLLQAHLGCAKCSLLVTEPRFDPLDLQESDLTGPEAELCSPPSSSVSTCRHATRGSGPAAAAEGGRPRPRSLPAPGGSRRQLWGVRGAEGAETGGGSEALGDSEYCIHL